MSLNTDNIILNNRMTQENLKDKGKSDKSVYIETYGCQMNFSDTEIVLSLMSEFGYTQTMQPEGSDVILINTCSVREHAETKIYNRLQHLKPYKKKNPNLIVGIIGCMAERLRQELLDNYPIVDLIIGPDEYRKVPHLIESVVETGEKGIAVKLSRVETYDDITPVRKDGVTAFLSVMRGCDKFCTFCVVPFTRGRERSRNFNTVVDEVKMLFDQGVKDVTLLGQNVNSYRFDGKDFSDLLRACARAVPEVRIRYTTSHPYDCSMKLLHTMAEHDNICKYIHLPIQSGSDRILKLMNRLYTVEEYMAVMQKARELMPEIGLSTDIISCFPTETEDDHLLTLKVINEVKYAYTLLYSKRENTKASKMEESICEETKKRRLDEIIELQREISYNINSKLVGKTKKVLIETVSKKSDDFLMGRTDCNKSVIIPKRQTFVDQNGNLDIPKEYSPGDEVSVKINKANSATLFGEPVLIR